jgi:hypothetical protein
MLSTAMRIMQWLTVISRANLGASADSARRSRRWNHHQIVRPACRRQFDTG